jgi:hypothetical protein
MRKIYVTLTVRIVLQQDEDIPTGEVVDGLDYVFQDTTGQANVVDTEITDYEVIDAK